MRQDVFVSGRVNLRRWIALIALSMGWAGIAQAADDPTTPQGFLAYPPYNGFVFEAVHLLPARHDQLTVDEVDDDTLFRGMSDIRLASAASFDDESELDGQRAERRQKQAVLTAVPDQVAAEFKAMQSAPNGDAAYAIGKHLPEAIRLYTAAAIDFHAAHPATIVRQADLEWPKPLPPGPMDTEQLAALDKALPRFQAVLDLPDAVKSSRVVAAAYMLGRSHALRGGPGDAAAAEKAFVLTRTLARAGMPDPQGLAVASFGDQARLRRAAGDLASTIGLYAEQAARGSIEGVESLKWVAQSLYLDPQGMAKVEDIPQGQRLLLAYALEINDDGRVREYVYSPGGHPYLNVDNGTMDLIVRTAKQWPKEKIAWPDRLASIAYRTGDFEFAHALVDGQSTALAWWLKAKMLLAEGKLSDAEANYKKALAMSPATPDPNGLSPFNESAACAELAQLERVRGEFVPAMRDQLACDRTYMGFPAPDLLLYLAERVLSLKELQDIVAALPPDPSMHTGRVLDYDSALLHSALAKRLVRANRYQEALSYADIEGNVATTVNDPSFDTGLSQSLKSQHDFIQAYATASDQTANATSAIEKAAAWYQLALLTRVEHGVILDHDAPLYKDKAAPIFHGVSASERDRLRNNYVTPDQDNLRWFVAFDDAYKAAQLLPPRSQAYAAVLCHAAHWMYQAPVVDNRDPVTGLRDAWMLYVKHGAHVSWASHFGHQCPDPDFDAAARPSWIKQWQKLVPRLHVHPWLASAFAFALLATVLVFASLRRLRGKKMSFDSPNT
ncbi:hypothetical protein [Dyella sp. C11]|uniref:hypothetical protein n=1 Tax=Dyella sp. C11 TaxID=2126991 RepID=UPI0013005426|nr:hypothetical protein [Dyella sp. C11]